MITVSSSAYNHASGIDTTACLNAKDVDDLVTVCVARATTTLETTPQGDAAAYAALHRHQISDVFSSMGTTHRTIRKLMAGSTPDDPEFVDSQALARLQLEGLYAVSLMLEHPGYVDWYVQDYWGKMYVQYLLVREECKNIPPRMRTICETGLSCSPSSGTVSESRRNSS